MAEGDNGCVGLGAFVWKSKELSRCASRHKEDYYKMLAMRKL